MKRLICFVLLIVIGMNLFACDAETMDAVTRKAMEAIAENEKIQAWLAENDWQTMTQEAIDSFKESIPALKEFLAREDVKQKFEEVERRFKDMGFDRAFPPGTAPETTIEALRELLHMEG